MKKIIVLLFAVLPMVAMAQQVFIVDVSVLSGEGNNERMGVVLQKDADTEAFYNLMMELKSHSDKMSATKTIADVKKRDAKGSVEDVMKESFAKLDELQKMGLVSEAEVQKMKAEMSANISRETKKDAEAMKVQFGSCCPDYAQQKKIIIPGVGGRGNKEIGIPALSRIIAARMIEIFEAIGYEIEKSGYKNMLKGGLVLTGGGARMQNIAQLATRVTGLEAKVAYPQERIAADSLPEVLSPENSTAVGLILAGFEIMDREKTVYQSVTPINYEFFGEEEEDKKPDDDNAEKPKEKKKLFKNLLNIFNTEKIFNQDNQA